MFRRYLTTICTAISAIFLLSIPAYSETLAFVRLEYSYAALVDDFDLDTFEIKSWQEQYEYTYRLGVDNASYARGDSIPVKVILTAKEGNDFKDIKAYACKLGETAAKDARTADDGRRLTLDFELPAVSVKLKAPSHPSFSRDGLISWDPIEDADTYKVTIFHLDDYGNKLYYTEFETDKFKADLGEMIYSEPGDYLFSVIAESGLYWLKDSDPCELPLSESIFISKEDVGYPANVLNNMGTAYVNGKQLVNCEAKIAGSWYRFDKDGKRFSGWYMDEGGIWYYYDPESFKRARGLRVIQDKTYYFDLESGRMMTGFVDVEGSEMFFDREGKATTGWVADGGKVYYVLPDGKRNYAQLIDPYMRSYLFRNDGSLVE